MHEKGVMTVLLAYLQFVKFSNIEEDTPSYHRRYDFFVSKFASMCHNNSSNDELRDEIRAAGTRGLRVSVFYKIVLTIMWKCI